MYIRTKTRTNKSGNTYIYAYLAQIKQRRSHQKQKIIKYLGRVYKTERTANNLPLISHQYSFNEMIFSLINTELENHGFKEISPKTLKKDIIEVNLSKSTVINIKNNKDICVQINQGLLCGSTLRSLLLYQPPKEDMKRVGKHFAKTVVEAGIQASQPVIIEIFKKLQTMINSKQQ